MIGKDKKTKIIRVVLTTLLLISMPIYVLPQIVEPPSSGDSFEWLRWVVVVLGGALVTSFGIIKKIYDDRIKDKDNEIKDLKEANKELSNEKDHLHKDIMDKVIPAVINATESIKSFMNKR